MNILKHLGLVVYLSTLALVLLGSAIPSKEPIKERSGIAVVELFTSQGCSSCPAADANLSEIIDQNSDRNIFGLSFHVSYWNYLGWKDPYSKEEYTARQREYASHFRNSTIYTPQMVVNGTREFVGSDKALSKKILQRALLDQPKHTIDIDAQLLKNKVVITYTIEGTTTNSVLNVALVERDLKNTIPRGENRNKTLHHDNVVRSFTSLGISEKGEIDIKLPDGFNLKNGSIIAYVQNTTSMEITGASASIISQ